MKDAYLKRTLKPGDAIKPYMVSGILEKDYTGDKSIHPFEIANLFLDNAIKDLSPISPSELEHFNVCGIDGQWRLFSSEAPLYADGHYYVSEKNSILPIYTELESPEDQMAEIELFVNRCALIINGEVVLNNRDINYRKWPRVYVFEHVNRNNVEKVTVNLKKGKNRFLYIGASYGRSTGQTFSARITSLSYPIIASIPISIDIAIRSGVHKAMQRTYLTDTALKVGTTAVLNVGDPETDNVVTEMEFNEEKTILTPGKFVFPKSLPVSHHPFKIVWKLKDGTPIAEKNYAFGIYNVYAPMPGYELFEQRRIKALNHLANKGNPLALFRLDRANEINVNSVSALCDKVIKRQDCADFHLLPLLWLAYEDTHEKKLDPKIHTLIKEAALNFRYWVDEPGNYSMIYCSENHRIGFHVCEYLAGLLYPTDTFTNCNQNGMYHSLKGRMHLVEWLSQRCKMGFDEPHSDHYLPVTLSALLCLREVLPREEYPIRNMVNVLLDFMSYIFATSNFDGVMATPRGRAYNAPLRTSLSSAAGGVFWILFGNCEACSGSFNQELAFSYYVPPKFICEIAEDYTPATFYFKEGLMHFDKHNADFTLRRTPNYMLGGVRDHNVGCCDMHFVPAMIALKGDVSIFFSAPQNNAEGNGLRPDYWAGQAFMPRVLMHGRMLAVIWHNVDNPKIWMTHVHFNTSKLDEYRSIGKYTFGRKGNGYVAIYSTAPHSIAEEGVYAYRELVAKGTECTWIAFCGSIDEDGSFEDFIRKILESPITLNGDTVNLKSPDGDRIEFGLTTDFRANGEDVEIPDYLCLSPYLKSKFGSGRFEYSYKGEQITQWTYPAAF